MSKEQHNIQFPILIEGYTAVKILGKGGMGEVYLAVNKAGNSVAIKISRNALRLKREYSQLQNIQHPRIVKVIDYKEVADYSYLVMEYLDAKTLKDIGRHFKKTIPLAVFSHIFAQVAAALSYIHNPENQQIHRDIKPQNIMILNKADNWGKISVKLMDFGLVKAPDVSQKLTGRGSFIGTATYTAPEQFLDASVVDYKADLYALGVTMYEVWTGERLFWGDTAEIRRQHLETPPPLASISRPDTPPALDQLLLSLLEKNSFKRPLSAEAVIAALSEMTGRVFCPHCGVVLGSQADTACQVCNYLLPDLWPGKVLQGRYRVEMKIGEGGFGTAYRALDLERKQPCVLKVTSFYREGAAKQFEFESRVLSKLNHPNLPHVYDRFSINDNEKCMVMNFAGQINLEQIRQRRRAPVKTVLTIADSLCDVLTFLHSQNPPILHRDIKPANIILSQEGQPMLIDFGIAREYIAGQTTTMSASGMLTPGYSPPEQYYTQFPDISQVKTSSVAQERQKYRGTDPRSDIYALGATLFALLTGKVPAESIILSGEHKSHPRINQINQYVSDSISDAVYKAMQLPKEDRFSSAAEFKDALHDPDFSYQNPKTVAKNALLARRRKETVLRAILTMIVMAAVFIGGVILYPMLFPGSTVSADMLTGLSQTQVSNEATSAALNIALLDAENSATLDVLGGMATAMASTSSSNERTQIAVQGFINETATQAVIQALTKPASGTKTSLARRTNTRTQTPTGTPTITSTATPMAAPDLMIDRVDLVGPTGSCVNLPITYKYRVTVYNQGTGDANNFTVNALGTMRTISTLKAGQSTVLTDIVKQSTTIMADYYNEVQESNEDNNAYIGNLITPTIAATCTPTRTVTATPKPAVAPAAPTFIYPVDGQSLVYKENYLFKIQSTSDYDYSLFTFRQNGVTVFEYSGMDTCSIYADSVDQNRFQPGFTDVIIKTNKGGLWSNETRITINLIPPVPSITPTRTPTKTPTFTPSPSPLPPPGPNLLGNAGFEDGDTREFLNWSFSPSNSSCSRAQHDNIWPFARTGARFLSTGRSPEYPNCLSVWQEVGIAPQVGQTYTAGFWLRNGKNANPPASQNAVIALWGTRGPHPESAGDLVTITDYQWSCHQLWFTPTQSGNTVLKIEIYLDKTWLGDVHADDLYLGYGKVQYCP